MVVVVVVHQNDEDVVVVLDGEIECVCELIVGVGRSPSNDQPMKRMVGHCE